MIKRLFIIILLTIMATSDMNAQCYTNDSMIVRIAEIEVYPEEMTAYLAAATEVGGISVREEPGVVCIFPMQILQDNNQIRILEIYRSAAAYRQHLETDHFLKYKSGTQKMVKSLKLIETRALDPKAMPEIFKKLNDKNLTK